MSTEREMTLDEWMARLPESHAANRELTALRARIAELEAEQSKWLKDFRIQQDTIIRQQDEITRLREALGALGVIGDGYCFCSEHRDPHKERHEPECRQASAALQEGE